MRDVSAAASAAMIPGVTVIVPVWNGRELLAKLLAGLRVQTLTVTEILAIDNGSSDGAAELAEREGARVIRLGDNFGFSRAVNRGITESRTVWLAIVNTDVEVAPDWLERLVAAAVPGVWFATGKILDAARRDRIDGTFDALCRGGCAWRVGHGRLDGPEFSQPASIAFAPLTAALFRAELFGKTGLLDERFESYLEDVDLGLRCATAGLRGVYVPDAVAYHQGSASLGRWHRATVRRIARNQVLLVAKHYPPALIWRLGWPVFVAQALWGLLAIRHGAGFAYLLGKMDGLRMFRSMRGGHPAMRRILEESERGIRETQGRVGFDFYWKAYFWLTRPGLTYGRGSVTD